MMNLVTMADSELPFLGWDSQDWRIDPDRFPEYRGVTVLHPPPPPLKWDESDLFLLLPAITDLISRATGRRLALWIDGPMLPNALPRAIESMLAVYDPPAHFIPECDATHAEPGYRSSWFCVESSPAALNRFVWSKSLDADEMQVFGSDMVDDPSRLMRAHPFGQGLSAFVSQRATVFATDRHFISLGVFGPRDTVERFADLFRAHAAQFRLPKRGNS